MKQKLTSAIVIVMLIVVAIVALAIKITALAFKAAIGLGGFAIKALVFLVIVYSLLVGIRLLLQKFVPLKYRTLKRDDGTVVYDLRTKQEKANAELVKQQANQE